MKKEMKKVLKVLTAAAMVFAITACSTTAKTPETSAAGNETQSQAAESKASEASSDSEKADITLRFAWWGGDSRHEATLKAIELYQQKNPNVKIEGEYQGYDGYYEKMMTTLSSGTAPDLFQFHRDWVADVQGAKHYLADLSLLPVDTSTLKEGILEKSGMYGGEPVLYPCSVGGQVLYVNTEFAAKFGLDTEKKYTWKEFMELGKKIHEEDPEAYLMTADIDVLNRLIVIAHIAQQTGGSLVNEDTYEMNFTQDQMTAALQNILDLYQTNTLEPFGEAAVFVGQMEQSNKWINGKIGVLMDITGACAKYEASVSQPIDAMTIPVLEGAKCSGVDFSGNMGFSINDASPNKEEAARFLDFIQNDPEAIAVLKDCRGYCSTETAEKTMEESGLLDPVLKKAVEISQPNSFSINAVSANTELETIRKDVIQEVIYGDSTPAEGAKEIVEQYQEILEGLKSK